MRSERPVRRSGHRLRTRTAAASGRGSKRRPSRIGVGGLSIVVVNRNGREFLPRCLESLRECGRGRGWEVVVVDNASDDGSAELVAGRFPEVKLLRTGGNAGFAKANNLGFKKTRAPFVLFLNPDTMVLEGALDCLLETLRAMPAAGACGPLLIRDGGRPQVSFGGPVTFFRELLQKSILNSFYRLSIKSWRKPRPVAWVSGACLLARREAVDGVAGFDENFFLYFEDIDLCLRMGERGWKVWFVPAARVFHEGGAATRGYAPSRYQYRKSQLLYYRKHNGPWSRRLLRAYLRANFLWLGLRSWLRRESAASGPRFVDLLRESEAKP